MMAGGKNVIDEKKHMRLCIGLLFRPPFLKGDKELSPARALFVYREFLLAEIFFPLKIFFARRQGSSFPFTSEL